MKKEGLLACLAILFTCCNISSGASLPGTMSRDFLWSASPSADGLGALSIAVEGEGIFRDVDVDGAGEFSLEAVSGDFYVGCDVLPVLTLFGTVGGATAKITDYAEYDTGRFKWSVGLNANLFSYDVINPPFMAGRLSIKSMAEYSRYEAGGEDDNIYWTDIFAAIPFGYEVFSRFAELETRDFHSVYFYIGPAFSGIDGTAEIAKVKADFNEAHNIGVIGGIDFYFASNLALGCYVRTFDQTSVGGGIRYHF